MKKSLINGYDCFPLKRYARIVPILVLALFFSGCSSPTPPDKLPQDSGQVQKVKIVVSESGMYGVTQADLEKAGFADALQDNAQLKLLWRGQEIPFWVDTSQAQPIFMFYSPSEDSIYSRERIYWLVRGDKAPADENGVSPAKTPGVIKPERDMQFFNSFSSNTIVVTRRLEENLVYVPQVEQGDHWLWMSLPAPAKKSFEIPLESLSGGPAHLTLVVWAGTEADSAPDHHIIVRLNGEAILDEKWDGKGQHILQADFASEVLRDGANQVEVEAPGDTGVAADITHINWFELEYARQPVAQDDQIAWIATGQPVAFTGFSQPYSVYDITDENQPTQLASDQNASSPFTGEAGHSYVAVSSEGLQNPGRIERALSSPDLRNPEAGGDYVAIGPQELLNALQPLFDHRRTQGLTPVAIPVQAVYDQFNHGYPEPQAIQNLMRYVLQNWTKKPVYLLLLGDASYDPRGYLAPPEANRLPTFLVNTIFGGETASDVNFVQINEDPWPDLAVGRVPARTTEQVQIFVEKTLRYEENLTQSEEAGVVAIADGQSASFRQDAEIFLSLFDQSHPTQLYAPDAGVVGANAQIKRNLEAGEWLVAYFGHGSVIMWGKDRLFTVEDVASLSTNRRLPVLLNMTCLTGLFTHPKTESLTEAMLWRPNGGAVAALAPSSLTLPTDQSFLSGALVDALQGGDGLRLGDMHLKARRAIPADTQGSLDVMMTFMLFGDPALQITR